MLVRQSKYDTLCGVAESLAEDVEELEREVRILTRIAQDRKFVISALRWELSRKSEVTNTGTPHTFTRKEIKQLISLCHPDKHHGRVLSKEMTQKLLTIKEKS